jgi:PTS system nitrogen regulatory IIA component
MRLGVREVAERMGVSEDTVFRWVDRENLPASRVDGQFRFSPAAVYEWATSRGVPIGGDLFVEAPVAPGALVVQALRRGGIVEGLKGDDREAVLRAAVARLELPAHADREVILHMLLARDKLGSSAIGRGFAVPHVRNPIVLRVPEPLATLFLLEHPIEFGALDRHPVHSLFLLITATTHSHLVLLSRLASVLQDDQVCAAVEQRLPAREILSTVERAEAKLDLGNEVRSA